MSEKSIKEQVNHAFDQLDEHQFQLAQGFISGLSDRLTSAERTSARGFLAFLLIWASIYLVAKGLVDEAAISGVKLKNLQPILIVGPIALGYVSYVFSAALATTMVLEEAIRECYGKLIPKLSETNLDTLISSHTFIGAEQQTVLTQQSWVESWLSNLVMYGIVFFSWAGSLAVICQVTVMLFHLSHWPRALILSSAFVGVLLWLRGASFIYHRAVEED
jgi:hypothetical protein